MTARSPFTCSPERPPGVAEANWVPIPRGPFNIVLRVYGPGGSAKRNTYGPPGVEPVRSLSATPGGPKGPWLARCRVSSRGAHADGDEARHALNAVREPLAPKATISSLIRGRRRRRFRRAHSRASTALQLTFAKK